uniref:ATP synthase complex subunit 8 n=1 Tax=Mellivora capensis TaxID=9664 RepID=A0A7U0KN60_MELCA|nr:ATP synthase F0 subunit 8 [Mellivora capensis]QQW48028.1 ATP synthase F0 subunit 8 [Mellivora capensis]UWM94701.1 ATP synthase F0 subunit 8 [Mellivora capensis]
MPQLDTSTWFINIMSMLITLFFVLQLKLSKHTFPENTEPESSRPLKVPAPWEKKWTKIYFPLSLPLQ